MVRPSARVVLEALEISSKFSVEASLNWCEKVRAWGVLAYEHSVGSYWVAFILIDRKPK